MSRADSYGQRIRNRAEETGLDVQRLRRSLVFQRVLARIAMAEGWVLKGGFSLETRLALQARVTVDLDLVTRQRFGDSGADLQDELDGLLAADLDDGFTFEVARPKRITVGDDRDAWSVTVTARVAGQSFATVRVDIVSQFEELAGAIERLAVAPPIDAPGLHVVHVPAVDVDQHAAEKLHAMMRTYAGDRPSSRVKDLVDLVLLIEAGVLDSARLARRLAVVYEERDGTPPPTELAELPASRANDYPTLLIRHELDCRGRHR